jgi:gluconolactonase
MRPHLLRLVALCAALAGVLSVSSCRALKAPPSVGAVQRLDPAIDALIAPDARIEQIADGFDWSEGPVWRRSGGYLLFTDVPMNTIYQWQLSKGVSVFLRPAGFTTPNAPGRELGSNGLTFDAQDQLVMADHGNRQIARLDEKTFTKTPLATRYDGKRLNSPNDLVFRANGDLFFTDPPYGLDGLNANPTKELPFSGVYRRTPNGDVTLLTRELTFPNGIALSPDERTLYVANSDPDRAIWMAYDLAADGSIANGRVLFDATPLVKVGLKGLPDGLKVDRQGNLFATGPGGVLIITPNGRHIGTIATGQATANCAFGDDGSNLYITADMLLLRIKTRTKGAGF